MKSKLLKRDYNQELEEIVESKRFGKEAHNLLLSMLYKIDSAYDDYRIVKREVPNKQDFLQDILNIVKNNCKEFEIVKPNSLLEKKYQDEKCKIIENKKIITFPNEKVILYNVIKAGIDTINNNLPLEQRAILYSIQIGKCIAYAEVIRDFNGFSWTSLIKEIENVECNVIYTDLIYLLGENKVKSFNSNNISQLKKIISPKLYEKIKNVAINIYISNDNNAKEELDNEIEANKKRLADMMKQDEFVENITKDKKNMLSRIKEIDELLNNSVLLRKKYIERNSKLPNEKKIFSVSHYEELLQIERKKILQQIEKHNKMLKPMEFVKMKTELENKIHYYENLGKIDIVDFQQEFFYEFSKLLKNQTDKSDLLNYIYKLRYLKFLPISKTEKMKDKIDFKDIEEATVHEAIKNGLIIPIANNKDIDYILLSSIFKTRSAKLEDLSIMLCMEDGKLKSEIYDGKMLDSTNVVELNKNSNIEIRKTKKIKIFN